MSINLAANLLAGALGVGLDRMVGASRGVSAALVAVVPCVIVALLLLALVRKQHNGTHVLVAAALAGPACVIAAVVLDMPWPVRTAVAAIGATVGFLGWRAAWPT